MLPNHFHSAQDLQGVTTESSDTRQGTEASNSFDYEILVGVILHHQHGKDGGRDREADEWAWRPTFRDAGGTERCAVTGLLRAEVLKRHPEQATVANPLPLRLMEKLQVKLPPKEKESRLERR